MSPAEEWRAAHARVRRAHRRTLREVLATLVLYPVLFPVVQAAAHTLDVSRDHHCIYLRETCWSPREHAEFALLVLWLVLPWTLAWMLRHAARWLAARPRYVVERPTTF